MFRQRGHSRVTRDGRLEVSPLGPIGRREGVLTAHRAGGRHIHGHAVQFLPDVQRINAGGSFAAPNADAKALTLTKMPPGDIDEDRGAALTDDESAAGLLNRAFLARGIESGADPRGRRAPTEPEP